VDDMWSKRRKKEETVEHCIKSRFANFSSSIVYYYGKQTNMLRQKIYTTYEYVPEKVKNKIYSKI
jgi:hypothetical protein